MCGRIVCFDGPWPWSCVLDLEVVAKEPGLRSTRRLCWIARCSFSTPTSLCGGGGTPWATGTTSTTTCTPCRARIKPSTTLPSIGARRARDGPWALACSDAGRVDGCERRGHWSHFTFNLYSKNSFIFCGKSWADLLTFTFLRSRPPLAETLLKSDLLKNYLGNFPN